jgi:teichuronic acid biosynthesis glycosyltransferase TuaC
VRVCRGDALAKETDLCRIVGAHMTIKTLLFSTLYPSSIRPSHGIFVETRLRHLLSSGEVQTRVVAPVPWFPSTHDRFGRWAKMARTPQYERRNGVEVWHPRYPLPPKIGTSVAPLSLALGARKTVARLLAEGDFDLFDAHYYYPDGAAAALLSRWFDKPFVITARGTDLNLMPEFAIPRRWIKWTKSQAAASAFVCQALRKPLEEIGGSQGRECVLRNGVDLELFQRHDPQASRTRLGIPAGRWLVSVGHLVPRKGHDIVIESLALLPSDTKLAIVGDGPERKRLERLAQSLGLTERVWMAGAKPQAELPFWYSAAEALILCSTREGWPNVLLEAMACGTPVVATAVWGTPEVVSTPVVGRLIEDRTPAGLARAVLDLISSPKQPEAVRRYATSFSWQETTKGQIDLFREVLDSERNARRG